MTMTRALKGGRIALAIAGGIVMCLPLLYLLSTSLMNSHDITAYPTHYLPSSLNWGNFSTAFHFLGVRTFVNSFVFSGGVVLIQLALVTPAGFALAKLRFRGQVPIMGTLGGSLFVPGAVTLIPTYIVTYLLHLLGTYWGLILPIAGGTSFGILLFRQYFVGVPEGLIEAARLDGANWFQTFLRIALPLARPAISAYVAVTFLTAWNMYTWPLIAATDPALQVLPLALAPLAANAFSTIPRQVGMAATVLSIIPVLIAFLVAQRWFVRGLAGTGIDY